MKRFRAALLAAVAAILVIPLLGTTAFAAWHASSDLDFVAATPSFGTGTMCDSVASTVYVKDSLATQHFTASANSVRVPVLNFSVTNGDDAQAADTLSSIIASSVIERAFSVQKVELWLDKNKDSTFSASQDSLMGEYLTTDFRFETNDLANFSSLGYVIPTDTTRLFWLTVDIHTDTVSTRPYDFDTLGVGIHINPLAVEFIRQGDGPPLADPGAINDCYPSKPQGYNIIFDTAPLKITDAGYTMEVDPLPCDGIINLGDSLIFFVDVADADTANVGSIKVYLQEFGGGVTPKTLLRVDNTRWEFEWRIPLDVDFNDGIDVLAGFYQLHFETTDAAGNEGDSLVTVNDPIDTQLPLIEDADLTMELYWDANGNEIVNVGDTVMVTALLNANPFGEITTAWTNIYGWGTIPDPLYVELTDDAGDRRFQGKVKVPAGTIDDTTATVIQVHATDNACNTDSASTWMANDIDLTLPGGWLNMDISVVLDADSNNCMGIGDQILISIGNPSSDIVAVYANMMVTGPDQPWYAGYLDEVAPGAVAQVELTNVSGNTWQLPWTLGEFPQDSAMDVAANVASALIWAIDDAGNYDTNTALAVLPRSVDTEYPEPVDGLECQSAANGIINLTWDTEDSDADWFAIFYDGGTGTIDYADTIGSVFGTGVKAWTTDGTVALTDGVIYKFDVWTVDDCGNWERDHPFPVACEADGIPPNMCVFQPDPGGVYGAGSPLTVYVNPADLESEDVESVWAIGRLVDRGDGTPGDWHRVSSTATGPGPGEIVFALDLNSDTLDLIVPDGTCKTVEIAIMATDQTGNVTTEILAYAACSPAFSFEWCELDFTVVINTIGGELPLAQPYCGNEVGFAVSGAENEVAALGYGGGRPPFKAHAWVEWEVPTLAAAVDPTDDIFYGEDLDSSITFNLDATGYPKGAATLYLQMWDVSGATTTTSVSLCVPDEEAPCAAVTSPIDGKCIRRALTDLDDVEIVVSINPMDNCIDPDGVAKIDFEWAQTCSEDPLDWNVFGIVTGDGGDTYGYDWKNKADLDWVTESGTIIYLRARVYDDQENVFTTACVAICVDIDTPPMCISSPDACVNGDLVSLSGTGNTVIAELDWAEGNIDDIQSVSLYWKKSTDADIPSSWSAGVAMTAATNSTIWRYDALSVTGLTDNVYYDFRIITVTSWNSMSYDYDGDGMFDAGTFDAAGCDMATWFIDNYAPPIYVDTVWTDINGQELIQPNVSCKLSDPRGWIWAQYNQDITVQPFVAPTGDAGDIVKVVWTLYSGSDATCECDGDESDFSDDDPDQKVLAIFEGVDALSNLTFNPADIYFVDVENGVQTHVLRVEAYDACGNSSEDCIEVKLLDIDETEAVIVEPSPGDVFCQDHDNDGGGINVQARTLLNEYFKKAIFYYRPVGGDWVAFDSTEAGGTGQVADLSLWWYPHALGLADGGYELTVAAEDYAGNRSTPGIYTVLVYLSCGAEVVVTLDAPLANTIIGCPFDLMATATSSDPNNPIVDVDFYYQLVTSSSGSYIGHDSYSVDDVYTYTYAPNLEGDYYLYAEAEVATGMTVVSEMVWVHFDDTAPDVDILQVGADPVSGSTVYVTVGDDVPVYAQVTNDVNGCALSTLSFYLDDDDDVIFGEEMAITQDGTYDHTFSTASLEPGTYYIWAEVTDGCCNGTDTDSWTLIVQNPVPPITVDVPDAELICDMPHINGGEVFFTATLDPLAALSSVNFYACPISSSDVVDQYVAMDDASVVNGVAELEYDITSWAEGTYRLRAEVGEFSDFSFDETETNHMLFVVDRSVPTPTFTLAESAIAAGTEFDITVGAACGNCDIVSYEYGIVTTAGLYGTRPEYTSTSCEFSFDPIDSGLVTLHNCYWGGYVRVTAYDALGNSSYDDVWVDVLDAGDGDALVTSPGHGEYVSGTVNLAGVALGGAEITFYYSALADGSDAAEITGGVWDTEELADGLYYLWAAGAVLHGAGCAVPVTVANDCADVVLADPIPSYLGHAGQVLFIGGTVDLMATVASDLAIDSVVFMYKTLDAPGIPATEGDPTTGWVWIATDRYEANSWDVVWVTDSENGSVADGYYVVMAFSYDGSGQECHSDGLTLFVDNTNPYGAITEINGDQTPATCADVTAGEEIELVAIAIDDRSPLGSSSAYNSGAKFAQFFAGYCGGTGGGGIADICFVIDYSGSMSSEIDQVKAAAADFANALAGSGLDYNLGLVEVNSPIPVLQTMSSSTAAFTAALENGSGGGGVDSYDAMTQITDGTINVGWRSGSSRFIVLICDTSPESGTASGIDFCSTPNPVEETTVANTLAAAGVTVLAIVETPTDPDYSGGCAAEDQNAYDQIVNQTGGAFFDLDAEDYSALFNELVDVIALAVGTGQTPVGLIWGKTVDLDTDSPVAYWNTTGLAPGTYCVWTTISDHAGNHFTSEIVEVCVYDKTPPVGWIAGFGDATVACPTCESHRIYGMTCDADVTSMKFEMRADGGTWTTIGITTSLDSALYYTDWNPCGLAAGTYEMRVVPVSSNYDVGTEEHIMWDIDASIQPILTVTLGEGCAMTYDSGVLDAITFEDKSAGNLGIVKLGTTTDMDMLMLGMLGVYQPLNEATLTAERVAMVQTYDMLTTYVGDFDDSDILLGGAGSFYGSYYDGMVSYLMMSDVSVSRVYPSLGMPGTLTNVATGASVYINRDAVDAENGVIILPAEMPILAPNQAHLRVWGVGGMATAIRLTTPIEGFNSGKYAKIKIAYDATAPDPSELAIAYWDGAEWVMNDGEIFVSSGAAGFVGNTVEFYAKNLHGLYAVVSDGGVIDCFSLTVEHAEIEPWGGGYTGPSPTIWTTVKSNIQGSDNNDDIDAGSVVVMIDDEVIFSNGSNAEGWNTTWNSVSGLLKTVCNFDLDEGEYTVSVEAKNKQGAGCSDSYEFDVDGTPPTVFMDDDEVYVDKNPMFVFTVSDLGSGVCYDSIYVDLFDISESFTNDNNAYNSTPVDKWFYTETPSGITHGEGGELYFALTPHIADYRRVRAVIYDGTRSITSDLQEGSQYVYDNAHGGVPDMAGNHANPLYRVFTVKGGSGTEIGEEAWNEPNPFDPWAGGETTIHLNASGGVVSVKIYDLAGEAVITLAEQMPVGSSAGTLTWDGKVDGMYVASGVYLCHISGENGGRSFSRVLKIAVVKRD